MIQTHEKQLLIIVQMERRAQMVINTCTALGDQNPIGMIHDVGAGGLSNALPERELMHPLLLIHCSSNFYQL